jgi:hypothetical protein
MSVLVVRNQGEFPHVSAPTATSGLISVDDNGSAREVPWTSIPIRSDEQVGGNPGPPSYSGIVSVEKNDGRLSETQEVEAWGYVSKPSRIRVNVGGRQSDGSGAACIASTDSVSDGSQSNGSGAASTDSVRDGKPSRILVSVGGGAVERFGGRVYRQR